MKLENKKILVIGGAGYVGTALTKHLLNLSYKVKVLDNLIYDNEFAIKDFSDNPNYEFLEGDMGNMKDLDKASKDITDVVLLAGLVGDPITKKYPDLSKAHNDEAIKFCIDYFNNRELDKLIFVSTCSNYGLIKEDELADENFELNPLSLYAKAKVDNESYLISKKGAVNYCGVVLRFSTAFGLSNRMRFDLTISEFTRDLFFGEELLVFDEHTWRPYCHVNDFARLIELVLGADDSTVGFEVFNAGGDSNNYTKKMIVEEILKEIPNGSIKYKEHGSDPRNYKVSFKKVKEILRFEPTYTVSDGIKELIQALKNERFSDSLTNKNKYGNYVI